MAGRHPTAVRDTREAAMIEIFKTNPGISAAKANEKFKAQFGSMMRNKRVYELRIKANGETTAQADKLLDAVLGPVTPVVVTPPVDNEHVAEGCEQFTPEQLGAVQRTLLAKAAEDESANNQTAKIMEKFMKYEPKSTEEPEISHADEKTFLDE